MNPETRDRLNVLSKELNGLLNAMHESAKTSQRFSLRLLIKNTFIYLSRRLRSVKGIYTIFGITTAGFFGYISDTFQFIVDLPIPTLIITLSILFLFVGALIRVLVLNEMSTIGSDLFHLSVYEKRKPKEYSSLINLAKEKDYITSLKDNLERECQDDDEDVMKLLEKLQMYEDQIEKQNHTIRDQQVAIKEKNEAIYQLLEELNRTEEYAVLFKEKSEFLIKILFQLKAKLNLLVNDQFNLEDFHFGSNYTLYKITECGLYFIGGYGINKAEMERFIPYSSTTNKYIRSIEKLQRDPLILEDFISWKRTLQDGSEWILSLHLDDSNRDKLNMNTEVGKLNITIIQEVLWICCELLLKFSKK